jgi:hypothetical protein
MGVVVDPDEAPAAIVGAKEARDAADFAGQIDGRILLAQRGAAEADCIRVLDIVDG